MIKTLRHYHEYQNQNLVSVFEQKNYFFQEWQMQRVANAESGTICQPEANGFA